MPCWRPRYWPGCGTDDAVSTFFSAARCRFPSQEPIVAEMDEGEGTESTIEESALDAELEHRDGRSGDGGELSADRATGPIRKAIDLREWFLLDGNRLVIAGGVVILIFGLLSVAEWTGLIPLTDTMPMFYLFSSLIGGNLTLITVVVSINQLLLSREFSSPGELQ